MVTTPILLFPDWEKTFHVHVDASSITLGEIIAHLGEGDLDHPIAFASITLLESKKHYNTTEREGLAMVYALQNTGTIYWVNTLKCSQTILPSNI
jgi:hypothetical protein